MPMTVMATYLMKTRSRWGFQRQKATYASGFFQGTPYDPLGPDGRFQLQAKLGFGANSSVWLAKDQQLESHVAVKILSGYASQLNAEMKLRELTIHEHLSALPAEDTKHCSQLVTHFIQKGIERDGDHLCLVLKLEQATLAAVRNEDSGTFYPVPIVKRILLHMAHGLAALHKYRVAHTNPAQTSNQTTLWSGYSASTRRRSELKKIQYCENNARRETHIVVYSLPWQSLRRGMLGNFVHVRGPCGSGVNESSRPSDTRPIHYHGTDAFGMHRFSMTVGYISEAGSGGMFSALPRLILKMGSFGMASLVAIILIVTQSVSALDGKWVDAWTTMPHSGFRPVLRMALGRCMIYFIYVKINGHVVYPILTSLRALGIV
ncbi:hypothetical protein K438DRAFT_1755230 [Mycena galopus ATCC 62051]|nr:hypothetical protein K438DRAFT_1755230 [Mycena galopus ATCC 62051]